ncbi:hypothetical protein NW768_011480 [Fusarium equiseti]|uniref:Zn(2)-C6 fungal-type domain-containing protein n=1 Tax=Fusarium equiseti TaxID=61235 RepID=A0ABQ8QXJ2_FUSEQ|nr:hypothetical protein NW768_011480 [Fusarium equiseti]
MPKPTHRRKIRSCDPCRQKKWGCDRLRPVCGRCNRTKRPQECTWPDESSSPASAQNVIIQPSRAEKNTQRGQIKPGQGDAIERSTPTLEALAQKVAAPESVLNNQFPSRSPSFTASSSTHIGESRLDFLSTQSPLHFIRGESFRTKYNGGTHPSLLVASIPGFYSFLNEAGQKFPALEDIRRRVHKMECQPGEMWSINWMPDGMLQALLPPKAISDRLVQAYLDSFDHIYHVLYLPMFRSQYESLWADVPSLPTDGKLVVIVLLIVAIAMCLTPSTATENSSDRSSSRNQASRIIQSCEQWLQCQSPRRYDLPDFQIHFLLLLAKQLNGRRFKQTWANSGLVIRTFMCAGLHVEPGRVPVDDLQHREIRRRLWASIAEFELQAAFEHGMPAMAWCLQSDMNPPSSMTDEDLPLHTAIRPPLDFTQASYLATAHLSLRFRHSLNTLLNDVRTTLSFEDVKGLTKRINDHLERIPQWICLKAAVPRALLSLTLHQYQLALHVRQIQLATSPIEKYFSCKILCRTVQAMTSLHTGIPEGDRGPLELLCSDHIRMALSLCYSWSTSDMQMDSFAIGIDEDGVLHFLQQIAALISNKFACYEGDQRQLWVVSALEAFIKTRVSPTERMRFITEAVSVFTASVAHTYPSQAEETEFESSEMGVKDADVARSLPFDQNIDPSIFQDWSFDTLGADCLRTWDWL